MCFKYSMIIVLVLILNTVINGDYVSDDFELKQFFRQTECQFSCQQKYSYQNCIKENIPANTSDVDCQYKCNKNPICMQMCICLNTKVTKRKFTEFKNEEFLPKLHCRSETTLVFKWPTESDSNNVVLRLQHKNSNWNKASMTNKNITTFTNLLPNNSYKLQLYKFTENGWTNISSNWTETLPYDYTLQAITNITLKNLSLQNDNHSYKAELEWIPAEDMVCFYDIVWWTHSEKYNQGEISKPEELYSVELTDLEFGKNCSVAIIAVSEDHEKESDKKWINFPIPTCLETFQNLSICEPPIPTGLKAEETIIKLENLDDGIFPVCDVSINWDVPELEPEEYTLQLLPISENGNLTRVYNLSGNSSNLKIENIPLTNHYQITLKAISKGGSSEEASLYREISYYASDGIPISRANYTILIIICIITPIISLAVIYAIVINKRARKKLDRCEYFEEIDQKTTKQNLTITNDPTSSCDEFEEYCSFEIQRDRVVLDRIIGEGAFGVVRHGWLLPHKQEIAVKMLKESASPEDIRQLKQEIQMMKTVGSHTHLVSMIGCCTQGNSNKTMLLVEYCALGDLLGYLHRSWNAIQQCSTPDPALYSRNFFRNSKDFNLKINEIYGLEEYNNAILTPTDLLSFARQIVIGMEYLASNRIVHRDLAARNVLLTADKTLKIADFGLSRDIYQENIYRKTGNGKLPIKWMALESLTHQIYTSQSDVWSFGIVLWEIVTLGGNPYPSTPTNRLLHLLKSGYRMECPSNCSQEIYSIMRSCWELQPKERPTFAKLREVLDGLLENNTPAKYLNLNQLSKAEYLRTYDVLDSLTDSNTEEVVPNTTTPAFSNLTYECNQFMNSSYG
ncbi:tyrosine-protein kinase receptor torso [Chrysoperla carnea]|uniref:tyrosine-protein kinase receptor torso n=1 Tax=Chrysoperla carnea TaxID=189513 RepID=UPI001D09402E|nr:tyrosine-protein kinase receptor torso [Chrysoperla carnea]